MDVSGEVHTSAALLAEKNAGTHWIGDWMDPWAPDRIWTYWRREKSVYFAGIQTPHYPIHSLVTTSIRVTFFLE